MNLKTFDTLKKMMALTFSDNDPEALASIRAANRLLAKEALDWERVLSRTVSVINEVEEAPPPRTTPRRDASDDARLLDEAVTALDDGGSEEINDFVRSLISYYESRGHLTANQRGALQRIIDRHNKGGRRR